MAFRAFWRSQAIEALPADQQLALLHWLAGRDRTEWDAQFERDFSAGGAGVALLERVNAQIERGEALPMNYRPKSA